MRFAIYEDQRLGDFYLVEVYGDGHWEKYERVIAQSDDRETLLKSYPYARDLTSPEAKAEQDRIAGEIITEILNEDKNNAQA